MSDSEPARSLEDTERGWRNCLSQNWAQVQSQVAESCLRHGRDPKEVLVLGVTKYVDSKITQELASVGCLHLAESRPQSLWQKQQEAVTVPWNPLPIWHLIGHLQRNKVRRTLPLVRYIHTVDSLRLAQQIQADAASLQLKIRILLEVNLTDDATKTGARPADIDAILDYCASASQLQLEGLMGMSSLKAPESQIHSEFAAIRQLRDRLQQTYQGTLSLPQLSMGMSGDYDIAIAHGATMVRIGSALMEGIPTS